MYKFLLTAIPAVLLAACANGAGSAYSGSNGKTLVVEPNVWSDYQAYSARISGTNPGVFVVQIVDDHAVSDSYTYCSDGNCRTDTFINGVFNECKAKGLVCTIFARNGSTTMNYKRAEQQSSLTP
jgi:hypothetical protein